MKLDELFSQKLRMLYDFHQYQNGLRADSIHATYLVYGTKAPDESQPDEDVEMGSSQPEHDDYSETVPTFSLTLVNQEDLKGNVHELSVQGVGY